MNTNQLLKCIQEDSILKKQCSGVYPMDKIPKFDGFPDSFILNLDPHDLPGSHWIAVFINHEKIGEFFDSYGNKPKDELLSNYLTKIARIGDIMKNHYKALILQCVDNIVCIFFVIK